MKLDYRLHRDEDLPELQRLWEESTTWGTLTAEIWRQHVVEAPLGGASIVVATDPADGRIVGEFAFIPSVVSVQGRELRSFRPAAPVVSKELRFRSVNPLEHPAAAMYLYAVKALRERGDGLIYMIPDPRWVRFFRMFPNLQGGSYPLWKLDLPLSEPLPLPLGYTGEELTDLEGERIDRLWSAWSSFYTCLVVRDSRSLPWKIGSGEYTVLGIEKGGELVGLVASRYKGDRQWLICDVLAADLDQSLRATLAAVSNFANEQVRTAPPDRPIHKTAVLVAPAMEAAARSLGFVRDDYDFPMIVHILDPAIRKQDVAPEKWYVSAND